ncbi:MAG: GumC family protein [Hyphomicrobiaceae bacterium]
MGASQTASQNDIDLATIPAVIGRSLKKLLIATVAVGAVTYGALSLVPSRYTSTAQISIGARTGDSVSNSNIAALEVDREAIRSRVQELRSPDLARRLANEMKLNLRPEFNSAVASNGIVGFLSRLVGIGVPRPGETEEERVLAAYFKALQVYEMKETRVIAVQFTARDSDLAAKLANRLIELYQQRLRQQNVSETTDASAWIAPEIEKRTKELSAAEAAVEKFRASANLFRGSSASDTTGLAEQQLTDLTSELTKARSQRSEAEARARSARDLMKLGRPDAIPDVQKSPVIQALIAQRVRAERELAEAATQLLPAHPRMRQLQANLTDLRRQIQNQASTIVEGLEREVKVLALREELAQRSLDDAKSRIGAKADDRIRLAQLEDVARATRREVATLRERLEKARTNTSTKPGSVDLTVIATARPSSQPSWPHRIQTSLLAMAATFVLGLVIVLFRALLAGPPRAAGAGVEPQFTAAAHDGARVRTPAPAPVRGHSGPPAAERGRAPNAPPARQAAPATGAFATAEQVIGRLLGNSAGHNGYRTVITASASGRDISKDAIEITRGLAEAGRQVILMDWSLDGQGAAGKLGVPSSPGFTDVLQGTHTFEDVIGSDEPSGMHILPCGTAPDRREIALDPERLNMLLDALDEAYGDVVVMGGHEDVRDLFLAVEGRFDAGVLIGPAGRSAGAGNSRFLGFDVTDIDVIRLDKAAAAAAQRTARVAAGSARTAAVSGAAT